MAGKSKIKKNEVLTKTEIDKLDRLDEIVQDGKFEGNDRFITALITSDILNKVFCTRDDEYIGLVFHCLSVIYKSKKDVNLQKNIIEIINNALVEINGLTVGKLLADNLADYAREISERGFNESSRLWWFSAGGIAVEDLKNIIGKLAPSSFPLFDWDSSLVLIKDGLRSENDYLNVRYQESSDKKSELKPKQTNVIIDKEKKQEIYDALVIDDPFEVESIASEFEYSPESYEALADALSYWNTLLHKKRKSGFYIFDLNEELGVLRAILAAMIDTAYHFPYAHESLNTTLEFLQSSLMVDDGDTDTNDESHEIRLEAIHKCKKLLN